MSRRLTSRFAAVCVLLASMLSGQAAMAGDRDIQACWPYPYDDGCTTNIAWAIPSDAKLTASASWHDGGKVKLYVRRPHKQNFGFVDLLRFDRRGRLRYTFPLPDDRRRCCWRFEFRAVSWDEARVLGRSNILRASTTVIDYRPS